MEHGHVRPDTGDAVLALTLRSAHERLQRIEAVIDTGADSALILPRPVIEQLSPPVGRSMRVELADGSIAWLPSYRVWVMWHGRRRAVTVLETTSDTPLAGMTLLAGSRLIVDVLPGGTVTVEEL